MPISKLLIRERKCLKTQNGTKPLTHSIYFELTLAQGESSQAIKQTIDRNLDERQVSK